MSYHVYLLCKERTRRYIIDICNLFTHALGCLLSLNNSLALQEVLPYYMKYDIHLC